MLVRAVHIHEKKKCWHQDLRALTLYIYILLFSLFAVPNCGSCHRWYVHSGGSA